MPEPSIMMQFISTIVATPYSFVIWHTNFIIGSGPMQMQWSYCWPSALAFSSSSLSLTVVKPFSP